MKNNIYEQQINEIMGTNANPGEILDRLEKDNRADGTAAKAIKIGVAIAVGAAVFGMCTQQTKAAVDNYDMMVDLFAGNTMSGYNSIEDICLQDGGQFEIDCFECTCETRFCEHEEWHKAYIHDSNFKLEDTEVITQYIRENWNTTWDTVHVLYDIPNNTVVQISAVDAEDYNCAQYFARFFEYVDGEDQDAREACKGLTDGTMVLMNAKNGYSVTYPDENNGANWDLFKLAETWYDME